MPSLTSQTVVQVVVILMQCILEHRSMSLYLFITFEHTEVSSVYLVVYDYTLIVLDP